MTTTIAVPDKTIRGRFYTLLQSLYPTLHIVPYTLQDVLDISDKPLPFIVFEFSSSLQDTTFNAQELMFDVHFFENRLNVDNLFDLQQSLTNILHGLRNIKLYDIDFLTCVRTSGPTITVDYPDQLARCDISFLCKIKLWR